MYKHVLWLGPKRNTIRLLGQMQTVKIKSGFKYFEKKPKPTPKPNRSIYNKRSFISKYTMCFFRAEIGSCKKSAFYYK